MELLIIRHAIAGDRAEWAQTGRPDHERPMTAEGERRMRENAAALRTLVPDLEVIATSPFTRAAETAAVVSEVYDGLGVVDLPTLAHGSDPEDVVAWLVDRAETTIALVGHEPDLGRLASWFIAGELEPLVRFKKGGACLLRFDGPPGPARGDLRWLAPPKLLRSIKT
jgi:phosphohistidine phosphatase